MNKIFCILLMLLTFVFFSCNDKDPTIEIDDTESPTITIHIPGEIPITSSTYLVSTEASDNDEIDYVEFLINGEVIVTDFEFPFEQNLDFFGIYPGTHVVTAIAYDRAGNQAESERLYVIYVFDFAPDGNGIIKVNYDSYTSDGDADDPYFGVKIEWEDEDAFLSSDIFYDQYVLIDPYYAEFDLPDDITEFKMTLFVFDDNGHSTNTPIDYSPDPESYYETVEISTVELPYTASFNGALDNNTPEDDCSIEVTVSLEYR